MNHFCPFVGPLDRPTDRGRSLPMEYSLPYLAALNRGAIRDRGRTDGRTDARTWTEEGGSSCAEKFFAGHPSDRTSERASEQGKVRSQ